MFKGGREWGEEWFYFNDKLKIAEKQIYKKYQMTQIKFLNMILRKCKLPVSLTCAYSLIILHHMFKCI